MINKTFLNLLTVIILSLSPLLSSGQKAAVQADSTRNNAVKIFLDCMSCDMNYTRQEIPYINYVRDVHDAQVVILVSEQNAGSGGRQYTYTFHGQHDFAGMHDTITYTSNADQTSTEIRQKRTDLFKIGLMRYVARTPLFNEINISHNQELESADVIDKWNHWVFELSTEPRFETEEAQKQYTFRNSFDISKVTEDLKLEVQMNHFYQMEKFIENPGTDSTVTYDYTSSSTSVDNLIVFSLNDHWSAGLKWDISSSTRQNYNFMTEFLPSVEYDIFPYSESTHHQLRILYGAGYQYNNYIDTTVFNKINDHLFKHSLSVAYEVQKKWGSVNVSLTGFNYFNDMSLNRVELNSFINFRIFRGLSMRIRGRAAHINDQINLSKGDVSEAERLLQLRELATSYRVEGSIQIAYTFGSIYNNVVNPRFGNGRYIFR